MHTVELDHLMVYLCLLNIWFQIKTTSLVALFLLHANDLHNLSSLDPMMFDDSNLFYEHMNLKTLFSLVN